MNLLNHNVAFIYLKDLLSKKFVLKMVTKHNKGRHELIQVLDDKGILKYFYCLFKHTPLHSFNSLAKDFVCDHPDLEGFGESINLEFLQYAKRFNAELLYIYPDGKIYNVHSLTIFNLCHNHKLIRDQDRINEYKQAYSNGMTEIVREKTCIFPIKIMSRWY